MSQIYSRGTKESGWVQSDTFLTLPAGPLRTACLSSPPGAARRAAAVVVAAFEFAVEWPVGDIALTIAELDGAAIVAAASRLGYYWPAAEQGNGG